MKLTARSLGLIGLMGGLGGSINASLLLTPSRLWPGGFSWQIIPAGAWHGSVLAATCFGFADLLGKRGRLIRWAGLLITGWVSGWLSYISIHLYTERINPGPMFEGVSPLVTDLLEVLVWPFSELFSEFSGRRVVAALLGPYMCFGLVGAALYLCLTMWKRFPVQGLTGYLLMGTLSGSLGSLWWWIAWEPWHNSLIHGTIWGSLVGFGIWNAQRSARA